MNASPEEDFQLFAAVGHHILHDFDRDDAEWVDSPFSWIRTLPSATRGKVGKRLVQAWCGAKGLNIDSAHNSEADLLLNGHPAEVKFSTLWKTGNYRFQQIRDQEYEYVICLGISPHSAHCWVISKDILRRYVLGHQPQHRGAKGTDTFWFEVQPENPPEWIVECGGTLDRAFEVLRKLSRR